MTEKIRNPAARRQAIHRQLLLDGAVTVEVLARSLGASVATIRRDLTLIEQEGGVRRTHGGAVVRAPRGAEQAFALREQLDSAAKAAIARAALALIEPDQTVLMNDGSTVLALAKEIVAARLTLTVATPGLNIAGCLSQCPTVTTYLLGGEVRHQSLGTSGSFAESMLQAINADAAFIAADGLSLREGLTYAYEADANLARLMSRQAATTVALVTDRKLGHRDRMTALPAAEVDLLVTDCIRPAPLGALAKSGIRLVKASPSI